MENSNNSVSIILALLAGAVIGGVAGVLFAPDKGSATRKKIIGQTEDLTETLKEQFNSMLEALKKEAETAKEKTSEYAGNGQEK